MTTGASPFVDDSLFIDFPLDLIIRRIETIVFVATLIANGPAMFNTTVIPASTFPSMSHSLQYGDVDELMDSSPPNGGVITVAGNDLYLNLTTFLEIIDGSFVKMSKNVAMYIKRNSPIHVRHRLAQILGANFTAGNINVMTLLEVEVPQI